MVGLGSGATIRGQTPDFNLEIAESDIQPEDIELLTRELNLKETTPTTLDALVQQLWPGQLVPANSRHMKVRRDRSRTRTARRSPPPTAWQPGPTQAGVNVMAAEGLHSKLDRVFNLPYVVEKPAADSLGEIIKRPGSRAARGAVLWRARDATWITCWSPTCSPAASATPGKRRTNEFRSHGAKEPRPLVIVVEEAHKLLNREMAAQTTFSTIAREMRKYYVTLLIIDQRPSQIYDEVMSQLGTRISGWLGDEDDIQAVLSGLAGRDALRGMLARLICG